MNYFVLLTVIFIVLKALHLVDFSWLIVFMPLMIDIILQIVITTIIEKTTKKYFK